jgi:ethanolamine ammonia-lyase small subunit
MSNLDRSLSPHLSELLQAVRDRTPARILVGRAGLAYRTATQLELRGDHAAALDAVHAELTLAKEFVNRWEILEARTCARSKSEYLMRPDLGRRLDEPSRSAIAEHCPPHADLQVAIGDGLSAAAVAAQVPGLLPLLDDSARNRGWKFGKPFVIRLCRVGVLNDIGELLKAEVVVLLIGERPGLATAESLSAYLGYRPKPGDTDAQRNLISNIHARGVPIQTAARRILALADAMRRLQSSGVAVKEGLPAALPEA